MTTTIHIATPCLNMIGSIDRTILSVVTQAGSFRIRYHVKDAGSDDGTVERLQWWQQRLKSGAIPIQCDGLEFSWSTEPDIGMYDAIIQSYSRMAFGAADFLTWINADDILMPGALALVAAADAQFKAEQISWLGGAACILKNDQPIVGYDRFIPTAAARAGICDGVHWDFVQQEGTFYRGWLWNVVKPKDSIRTMKFGGDWKLWRLFASHASLVQWGQPLAAFRIRPGQLSSANRGVYEQEIDELVPKSDRRKFLEQLGEKGLVQRRRLKSSYPEGQLSIVEEEKAWPLKQRYERVFGKPPSSKATDKPDRLLAQGEIRAESQFDVDTIIKISSGIIAYDDEWQFPAVTEQHAFHRVRELGIVPPGVTYVAYPWATLIDKLQDRARDGGEFEHRFRKFLARIPKDTVKVTVCQQILMRRFMHLFAEAGIDHIYWTHATPGDAAAAAAGTEHPAVHPFPLYPVQMVQGLPAAGGEVDGPARKHLFSFVGARADQHYPRQTRNFILDHLASDGRGFVAGRDQWFYHRIVYTHQVHGAKDTPPAAGLIEQEQAAQFRAVLEQSVFSLCPAGTGPNSIRLWESIGAGAIPVILADQWAPPGNRALWEAAAIFRAETEEAVKALPDELEAIARDPELLAAKRHAMRQLWLLYGPEGFVHDIEILMLELAAGRAPAMAPLDQLGASMGVTDLTEAQARTALTVLSGALLVNPSLRRSLSQASHSVARLAETAVEVLNVSDPIRRHFEAVQKAANIQTQTPRGLPAPFLGNGIVPRVNRFGRHSHRTPLSYAPFLREIPGRLAFVDNPEQADLLLTGFNRDFNEAAEQIGRLCQARPDLKLLVLSEEPLWDSHWSGGYIETERTIKGGHRYRSLNHRNSELFNFKTHSYLPLTDDAMLSTYAMRMCVASRLTPKELLRQWKTAPIRAAFFAEHRLGQTYDKAFRDDDIWGLCNFRTEVAQHHRDTVRDTLCVGKGWGEQPLRQQLPSWHLDKLATLTGRTTICSAIENTHQVRYVSEKIFDAFAVGAIPVYYANTNHRVFEFVPAEAMINVFGLDPKAAAEKIAGFEPDLAMAEAWSDTARKLFALFSDTQAIHLERKRFADMALEAVLDLVETDFAQPRALGPARQSARLSLVEP